MAKLTENMVQQRLRSCMSDIGNVVKINFTGRELQDISLIRQMTNVEVLSLSVNRISTLVDLQFCKNLKELYLRKNDISDLREICYLQNLPFFEALWLAENPCTTDPNYRLTVIKNLPQLRRLDDIFIDELERKEAAVKGKRLALPDGVERRIKLLEPEILPKKCEKIISEKKIQERPMSAQKEEVEIKKDYVKNFELKKNNSFSRNDTSNKVFCDSCQNKIEPDQKRYRSEEFVGVDAHLRNGEHNDTFSQYGPEPMRSRYRCRSRCEFRTSRQEINKISEENSNILSAVLSLVKELDRSCLEVVGADIERRLQSYDSEYS